MDWIAMHSEVEHRLALQHTTDGLSMGMFKDLKTGTIVKMAVYWGDPLRHHKSATMPSKAPHKSGNFQVNSYVWI